MVLSRAFTVAGVPRMLPFVDMLNHHPSAGEITINAEGASISVSRARAVVRNRDIHVDQQLDTSTGQQTNTQQRQTQRVTLSTVMQRAQQRQERGEEAKYDAVASAGGAGDGHVIADHERAVSGERSNESHADSTDEHSRTVSTWSKRALVTTETETGSNMAMDRLEDGAAVEWAYKSSEASNFDLLYLYGFVSAHPLHAFFPLRMEWAASSPMEAQRAYSLFVKAAVEKTSSPSVETLPSVVAPALALTLRFRADGSSKSDLCLSLLHCYGTVLAIPMHTRSSLSRITS